MSDGNRWSDPPDTHQVVFSFDAHDEAKVAEVVSADAYVFESGHRLRPSHFGVLTAAGDREVDAFQRPTAGVVPTGGEPASRERGSGNHVGTSGLTVSQYVEPMGRKAALRTAVPADYEPLNGLAVGWAVVPEQTEAVPSNEMTEVELWEYYP